jgi:hypothetical protein
MRLRRQDRVSGTDQEPLAQRLWFDMTARLAVRLGVCPVHATRVVCCVCDVQLTSSAAEEAEMEALLERAAVPLVTWPCARCDTQDAALCVDCQEAVADQAFAGLTPAEEARLSALLSTHVRYTFVPDDPIVPHEPGETP